MAFREVGPVTTTGGSAGCGRSGSRRTDRGLETRASRPRSCRSSSTCPARSPTTSELEPAERAALDQGVTVRRGQGYTLRVSAVPAVHRGLLARCQPLDGVQGAPAVPASARPAASTRTGSVPSSRPDHDPGQRLPLISVRILPEGREPRGFRETEACSAGTRGSVRVHQVGTSVGSAGTQGWTAARRRASAMTSASI